MPQQIDPNTGQPIGVNMGDPMIPQYIPGLPGLTQARLVNGAADLKPFEYLRNEGGRYYAQNALTNPEESGAAIPPPVQMDPGAPSVSLPPPSPPPNLPPPTMVDGGSRLPPGMSSPAVMPPNFDKMFRGFNPFGMGGWGGLPRPYGGRLRQDAAQSNMGMGAISRGAAQPSWGMPPMGAGGPAPQTGGGDPWWQMVDRSPFGGNESAPGKTDIMRENLGPPPMGGFGGMSPPGGSGWQELNGLGGGFGGPNFSGGFSSFGFPMMRGFTGAFRGGYPSGLPQPTERPD